MRSINAIGFALIKEFEGCRLTAYDDLQPSRVLKKGDKLKGALTIGHGHTGPDVSIGQTITAGEAERLLKADLGTAEGGVERAVTVKINDNEFAALVSLAFNIGLANFRKSTLLQKLNAEDREGAAQEFARWNKAGGKVLAGLTRRRAAERGLFLTPVAPPEKPKRSKKRSVTEWLTSQAPMLGGLIDGWEWKAIVAVGVLGIVGLLVWRWLESRKAKA